MYRPVAITVSGCLFSYQATVTFADDGLAEDGSEQMFRGFDTEQGGYYGLTARRAWRKAYRAVGGRLWDLGD